LLLNPEGAEGQQRSSYQGGGAGPENSSQSIQGTLPGNGDQREGGEDRAKKGGSKPLAPKAVVGKPGTIGNPLPQRVAGVKTGQETHWDKTTQIQTNRGAQGIKGVQERPRLELPGTGQKGVRLGRQRPGGKE